MIRFANRFDLETICDLLESYCREYPSDSYKDESTWDREYAKKQVSMLMAGMGFVLIDDKNKGILCAVKVPSFWIKDVFVLQELVWYGLTTRVAVDLINKFIDIGNDMKDSGEVKDVCFTSIKNGKFEKLNVRKAGYNWAI
jgi:hypothetical protein